jgi:hypothetical protein
LRPALRWQQNVEQTLTEKKIASVASLNQLVMKRKYHSQLGPKKIVNAYKASFWDRVGYGHPVILFDTFCVRLGCFQFRVIFSE